MNGLPITQGFYVFDSQGWEPARSVPCDHLLDYPKYAVLRRDFAYVSRKGVPIVAEIGFAFDGLSKPRLVWRVAGHPWDRYLAAGVIHDHVCSLAESLPPGPERNRMRLHGDELFAECLEAMGASRVTVATWYRSVRLGAVAAQFRARSPDYRTDLGAYYACLGLYGLDEWVQARRERHEVRVAE